MVIVDKLVEMATVHTMMFLPRARERIRGRKLTRNERCLFHVQKK
jgi:hypothetical protein